MSSCATNGGVAEGPSLYDRIKTASQSIKVVNPNSPDWCGPEKTCKYLGEIYCEYDEEDSRNKKDKICNKEIFTRIVQHGGDTFVLQQQGMVKGTMDHYRSFGQVYNCTDANQALHNEYVAKEKLKPLTQLKIVSIAFAEQCNTTTGCKKDDRKWSCGSIQGDPHSKCREKFDRDLSRGTSKVNYIVYKNDLVNKAGFYRLYVDSYICK